MTPRNAVLLGDCIERMRELDADSVDAIVCDPPYGLEFMGKAWDGFTSPQAFAEWCRHWAIEALRVLKPGGHLLAFGGTRTYHRLVSGLEDAGFEVRDTIAWLYGSGFPKSKNIGNGFGTALKPAHEPIVVARKPLVGTVAANVERYGTGALNIDGCRVGWASDTEQAEVNARTGPNSRFRTQAGGGVTGAMSALGERHVEDVTSPLGRWPANVAHDGSHDVLELFPHERDSSAARFFYCAKASRADREAGLDESGPMRLGATYNPKVRECRVCGDRTKPPGPNVEWPACQHNDYEWVEARSRRRANDHPTVKPHELMRWLVRLVGGQRGSLILDPFAGSGSTLRAARAEGFDFLGIERDPHYYRLACLRAGLPDPGEQAA